MARRLVSASEAAQAEGRGGELGSTPETQLSGRSALRRPSAAPPGRSLLSALPPGSSLLSALPPSGVSPSEPVMRQLSVSSSNAHAATNTCNRRSLSTADTRSSPAGTVVECGTGSSEHRTGAGTRSSVASRGQRTQIGGAFCVRVGRARGGGERTQNGGDLHSSGGPATAEQGPARACAPRAPALAQKGTPARAQPARAPRGRAARAPRGREGENGPSPLQTESTSAPSGEGGGERAQPTPV